MPEINQHGQTVNDIVPDWKCARALTRTLLTGCAVAESTGIYSLLIALVLIFVNPLVGML